MATTNGINPSSGSEQLSRQFSTFFVDDLFFGVDVLDVQEVLRSQQMTPVPQAPDVIEGLINLRGQIVTAIDMRRRLMLPPREEDQAPMNMVVRTSDGAVSLLVDEIGDVLDMDAATYERAPENLDAAARDLIRGVYKLNDRLLLVLDTEKAIDVGRFQPGKSGSVTVEAQEARRHAASTLHDLAEADAPEPAAHKSAAKKTARKSSPKKASGTGRTGNGNSK